MEKRLAEMLFAASGARSGFRITLKTDRNNHNSLLYRNKDQMPPLVEFKGKIGEFIKKHKTAFLLVGWSINVLFVLIFVAISCHTLEVLFGLTSILLFYIGCHAKDTALMCFSIFNAVWLMVWGLGFAGNRIGAIELFL
ncbi:MAG: hypothetical protein R6W68_16725 [Ignavibacteriaceae bacterium]